jgi:SAM-dependent methyltransferase
MASFSSNLGQQLEWVTSIPRRAQGRFRLLFQGRLRCFKLALSLVEGKTGIEIGGPTDVFFGWPSPRLYYGFSTPLPIYDRVGSLDNCNFSSETLWSTHQDAYQFSRRKEPGKNIIADGSALGSVANGTYDFVLSSHNLEHFANPVKALMEWKRISRPRGALILVLPDFRRTFDHRRTPTAVSHMIEDYSRNVGEDDPTHIPEVLRLHDLDMDGTLKTHTLEELRARSMSNVSNRVLHHHVFDENNSVELLTKVGLDVLAVELALPYHMFLLGRWKE